MLAAPASIAVLAIPGSYTTELGVRPLCTAVSWDWIYLPSSTFTSPWEHQELQNED